MLRAGMACWQSARLVIKKLRVQILAGAVGEFSSPELTLCADSYSVSVPPLCYRSGMQKDPGHSAESAGGRFHLNMHIPMTQRSQGRLKMR